MSRTIFILSLPIQICILCCILSSTTMHVLNEKFTQMVSIGHNSLFFLSDNLIQLFWNAFSHVKLKVLWENVEKTKQKNKHKIGGLKRTLIWLTFSKLCTGKWWPTLGEKLIKNVFTPHSTFLRKTKFSTFAPFLVMFSHFREIRVVMCDD